jgi:hypothetical protein
MSTDKYGMRKYIDIIMEWASLDEPLGKPGSFQPEDHRLASQYHYGAANKIGHLGEKTNHLWLARYHGDKAEGKPITDHWSAAGNLGHKFGAEHHGNRWAWMTNSHRGNDWQVDNPDDFHQRLADYHRNLYIEPQH